MFSSYPVRCAPLDSDVYVGEWQRGQREGKGVLSLANGDRSVRHCEATVHRRSVGDVSTSC